MSEANIVFTFRGNNQIIQCSKDEKMIDICKRYSLQIEKNVNTLVFIYDGNQLNLELSFEELANSIDKNNGKMNILVYENRNEEFICPKCGEKLEINQDKIDEIILLNNNIKDKINELKMNMENIINNSLKDLINNQLKNNIALFHNVLDYINFLI